MDTKYRIVKKFDERGYHYIIEQWFQFPWIGRLLFRKPGEWRQIPIGGSGRFHSPQDAQRALEGYQKVLNSKPEVVWES